MRRSSPTLYAHRGASLELPENTIEAFRLAVELGADALETDAHLTRDGHVVLSHDPTGARMAGVARAICESTLAEVRTWNVAARFDGARFERAFQMPTLGEALAAFPTMIFNVDAKQTKPDMMPALLQCIRAAHAVDRVRIASFSTANLLRARRLGYEGETGLAVFELARIMLAPRFALTSGWVHPAGHAAQVPRSAYGIRFATQSAIDRMHQAGVRVDFWTIDDPNEAKRLLAMGADGVMTDDIRTIAAAFGRAPHERLRAGS